MYKIYRLTHYVLWYRYLVSTLSPYFSRMDFKQKTNQKTFFKPFKPMFFFHIFITYYTSVAGHDSTHLLLYHIKHTHENRLTESCALTNTENNVPTTTFVVQATYVKCNSYFKWDGVLELTHGKLFNCCANNVYEAFWGGKRSKSRQRFSFRTG